MGRKKKIEQISDNIESKLGIKPFEDENLKIVWFTMAVETIKNSYLVTLKYIPKDSKLWYQDVYSLKSTEEIETFTSDVIKHLI